MSLKGKIGIGLAAVLAAGICYYITLPALNIHSVNFWMFILTIIFLILLATIAKVVPFQSLFIPSERGYKLDMDIFREHLSLKIAGAVWVLVFAVYLVGNILSSPVVNAAKYQSLLKVQERVFSDDIKETDYDTIPLLDKDSAALLGNRKMGSLVDMVSQFEVADDYAQINYRGKPVRVTPLVYASTIKWLTNFMNGIPAYILIDMASQDTECVKLTDGIKYSKSEYFNRYLYRHLRFKYPTYIFDDQLFFEIDEEGTPYWVCPVKKFNIGLFGGQTVGRVVLCNACTGECVDYSVEEVPAWVDKVYAAELLTGLYDYSGLYKHGFFNSILGQKDCLQSTNGYNYIALDDDVWVYTGVTSVSGDQSNVGFVLMNQRTMETRFYKVEGAIEDSAMSSAEGQVQNLGYRSTFPLLLNIADEPTYFMALKDAAGLVKKYAMLNVQKYQWVAIGDTIRDCEKNYNKLLSTNGIISTQIQSANRVSGTIETMAPIVIGGSTHYYICLSNNGLIFDVEAYLPEFADIIRYKVGDRISFSYKDNYETVVSVSGIE